MIGKEDTIVALATPAGAGAIAIIRLSGTQAIDIADSVFQMSKGTLKEAASHTVHFGKLRDGEKFVDEGLALIFRSPASYTGEDVVEFSCHGSVYIQQQVIQLLIHK